MCPVITPEFYLTFVPEISHLKPTSLLLAAHRDPQKHQSSHGIVVNQYLSLLAFHFSCTVCMSPLWIFSLNLLQSEYIVCNGGDRGPLFWIMLYEAFAGVKLNRCTLCRQNVDLRNVAQRLSFSFLFIPEVIYTTSYFIVEASLLSTHTPMHTHTQWSTHTEWHTHTLTHSEAHIHTRPNNYTHTVWYRLPHQHRKWSTHASWAGEKDIQNKGSFNMEQPWEFTGWRERLAFPLPRGLN